MFRDHIQLNVTLDINQDHPDPWHNFLMITKAIFIILALASFSLLLIVFMSCLATPMQLLKHVRDNFLVYGSLAATICLVFLMISEAVKF